MLRVVGHLLMARDPANDEDADASKLIALENAWNQAQLHHDAKALNNLVSDSFVYTDYDGTVMNKARVSGRSEGPGLSRQPDRQRRSASDFLHQRGHCRRDLSLQGNLQAPALRTLRTLHRYLALPEQQVAVRGQPYQSDQEVSKNGERSKRDQERRLVRLRSCQSPGFFLEDRTRPDRAPAVENSSPSSSTCDAAQAA